MTFCLADQCVEEGLVGIADTRVLTGNERLMARKTANSRGPALDFMSNSPVLIGSESVYGRPVMKGVLNFCRLNGRWEYRLTKDTGPRTMEEATAAIREWKADGIIAHVLHSGVNRLLRGSGLPFVNVGGLASGLPAVIGDNLAAGRLAARHLLDNGLRNFAYVAIILRFSHLTSGARDL